MVDQHGMCAPNRGPPGGRAFPVGPPDPLRFFPLLGSSPQLLGSSTVGPPLPTVGQQPPTVGQQHGWATAPNCGAAAPNCWAAARLRQQLPTVGQQPPTVGQQHGWATAPNCWAAGLQCSRCTATAQLATVLLQQKLCWQQLRDGLPRLPTATQQLLGHGCLQWHALESMRGIAWHVKASRPRPAPPELS
jgi:hypothetical protein